jgi:CRP-like cAMP-binding protein
MQPRHCDDGEGVYALGEEGNELYMIETGQIRFCNYTISGKEIQIGEMRAGDCFGELSLIDGLYRANCAYAQGPADLLILKKQDFDALCAEHIEIPLQINKLLSHRLRMTYTLVEDASVLPMKDRLARLLGRLGYSVGITDADGAAVLEGFTHEGLARMLGSTREAITRELRQMEQLTLIQRRYGKILIPNIAALISSGDRLLGGEPIVPDYD